jgi:hypothetical protein
MVPRIVVLVALLGSALAAPLLAQKNCTKGKPCGRTCIARDKICRIGSSPPVPAATAAPSSSEAAAQEVPLGGSRDSVAWEWVASTASKYFYRNTRSCAAPVAQVARIYFRTEESAVGAGFEKTSTRACL